MSRKRTKIVDKRDPTIADGTRSEDTALSRNAASHFTEDFSAFDYGDSDKVQELEEQLEKSIVPIDDNSWRFGRFELTKTSLITPDDLSDEEVSSLGFALSKASGSINFWLGDWANLYLSAEENRKKETLDDPDAILSEEERNKIYSNLVEHFGLENVKTLRQYSSVCRNLPPSVRTDGTHWSNHELVAFLPKQLKGKEADFLQAASSNQLTKRELKSLIVSELSKLIDDKPVPHSTYLFSKDKRPRVSSNLEKAWLTAMNGTGKKAEKARTTVLGEISKFRKWLDELENSLDE